MKQDRLYILYVIQMFFVLLQEKVGSGVVLVGCLLAVPLYVLGNIKNYRRMKGTL